MVNGCTEQPFYLEAQEKNGTMDLSLAINGNNVSKITNCNLTFITSGKAPLVGRQNLCNQRLALTDSTG